jgi:hypothetical protein
MADKQFDILYDGDQIVLDLYTPLPTPACSLATKPRGLGKRALHEMLTNPDIPSRWRTASQRT